MHPHSTSPTAVIKVGGSLLSLHDLTSRLFDLLSRPTGRRPLLIAGGGAMVDVIRDWSRQHALSETACHDLALKAMDITAALLVELLPNAGLVDQPAAAVELWQAGKIPVLRMDRWFQSPESAAESLPKSWDVTSDSLAAFVAQKWQAEELWLLKATDLPDNISPSAASGAGLVDAYFPAAIIGVAHGCWCNLRAEHPELRRWW